MKLESVQSGIFYRGNGIVWTDQRAHGTSNTGIFHTGFLADTIKDIIIDKLGGICFNRRFKDFLLKHFQFNRLDRAYGSALATQGTSVIVIHNLPGQIIQA